MAQIDSDDSLSDQADYTETGILLGYASKEPTEDEISHIGGHPSFISSDSSPPASYSRCKVCGSLLSLLLQLNGDLPEHFPDHERRLYIFACRQRRCMRKDGSIHALRETRRWRVGKSNNKSKESRSAPEDSFKNSAPEQPTHVSEPNNLELGGAIFGVSNTFTPRSLTENPFMALNSRAPSQVNPCTSLPAAAGVAAKPPENPTPTNGDFVKEDALPPTSTLAAKTPQQSSTPPFQNSTNTIDGSASNLPGTFASKLHISPSSQKPSPQADSAPWPPYSSFPPPYPISYLDADYETLIPASSSKPLPTASSSKYDVEDSPSKSTSSTTTTDLAESAMDTTFQRFSDRLAQNPEQILRYEFNGHPLLYSGTDAVASRFPSSGPVKIPRCENCGAQRVFELQLVPGAISALEDGVEGLGVEEGMEWGTVILGACAGNCGAEGEVGLVEWREEWVGVQWEERVMRK